MFRSAISSPRLLMSDEQKVSNLIQLFKKNNQMPDSYFKMLEVDYASFHENKSAPEIFDTTELNQMIEEKSCFGTPKVSIEKIPRKFFKKYGALPNVSRAKENTVYKAECKKEIFNTWDVSADYAYDIQITKNTDEKSSHSKPISSFYEYLLYECKNEIFYQLHFSLNDGSRASDTKINARRYLTTSVDFSFKLTGKERNVGNEFQALFKGNLILTQEKDADVYSYKRDEKNLVEINYYYLATADNISIEDVKYYVYHICKTNHPLLENLLLRAIRKAGQLRNLSESNDSMYRAALRAEQIALSMLEYKKDLSIWMYTAALIYASEVDNRKLVQAILNEAKVGWNASCSFNHTYGVVNKTALGEALANDSVSVLELFQEKGVNFNNPAYIKKAGLYKKRLIALFCRDGMTPYEIFIGNACSVYYSYNLDRGGWAHLEKEKIEQYKKIIEDSVINYKIINKNKPHELLNVLLTSADFPAFDLNLSNSEILKSLLTYEKTLKSCKLDTSKEILYKVYFAIKLLYIYSEHEKVVLANKLIDAKTETSSCSFAMKS